MTLGRVDPPLRKRGSNYDTMILEGGLSVAWILGDIYFSGGLKKYIFLTVFKTIQYLNYGNVYIYTVFLLI